MRCVCVRSDGFSEPFTINIGFVSVGFHVPEIATVSDGHKQQILKSYVVGDCSGIRLPQGAAVLARVIAQGRWKHSRQSPLFFKASILRRVLIFCNFEYQLRLPREAASHTMDLQIITEVLVVVVIGGLGNVLGTYIAAIIVSSRLALKSSNESYATSDV